MRLIIRGAVYFDGDEILIPQYTGEFFTVDCIRYCTKQQLIDYGYNNNWFKEYKDDYYSYNGKKYYFAEYSMYNVNSDWELLSNLSSLAFTNENFVF